ncbi:MAG: hypothetical protein J5765_05005 [Clostridia bacterium]|nr:hypothetical protein [Clostridia bacterium]
MADKKKYDEYLYYLSTLLKQEDFYSDFSDQISQGKNSFQVSQRFQKQIFDESWIDTLEDCIVALDTIVRNPRKFIVVEEDIVDISLARSISVESVKHLAQHTNFISSVTKDGMVIPSKILNTSKEESYEIYENRFIYTLLLKTKDFIGRRYNLIKQANANSDQIVVNVTSDFGLDKDSNITYTMSTTANMPVESVVGTTEDHTLIERVERINSIVGSFLMSPFAKEMVSCALVRPPITRTNVILKDPNFKKALVLWQFIESYNKVGFEVETVTETRDLAPAVAEKYRDLIYLNTLVIESMAARAEGGIIEEKELEKQKNLENEYLTKNIDDFVPDDFPQLHMDLHEIRRLYTTVPGEREVPMEDLKKMNAALDRVIRQHKINVAKEDSARQKALLKQQLKEEEQLKLEALRQAEKDAKEAEKRRIQEEKERIRAQKEAEKALKEAEKAERERIRREKREAHDRIVRAEERLMRLRLCQAEAEMQKRLAAEQERLAAIQRSEEERMETEKQLLAEQLEREKAMSYIAPIEGEALLLLRKKEIRRIEEMRRAQEQTMQQLITTHYADMEAQQRQAIIDMEELAQMINFDNVTASEQEKAEAMQAEDVNVLTYGKEQINSILNDKLTEEELAAEKENAVAPTPEVGDYGYTELGQDAEEVVFELVPEAEPEPVAEEEAPAEEPAPEPEIGDESALAGGEDDWSFIDQLAVDEKEKPKQPAVAVDLTKPEDRENVATSREERRAFKQRMKEEAKAKKAEEKRRKEQEKQERKERMKRLEEENKAAAAASFAPTAPRPKRGAQPNPLTPTAEEILAPKPPVTPPTEGAEKPPIATITASGGTTSGARPRTFVPRSYTPISVTPENIHEVLGDGKDKKKDKKKK